VASKPKRRGTQAPLSFMLPATDWRPPDLSSLPDWTLAKRIAIDTETNDPHLKELGIGARRGGYVCGYSFAIEDGPRHYVPLRHEGGDNADVEQGLNYLRAQARAFRGTIVGQNIAYDLDYLANEEIDFSAAEHIRDVMVTDPLIYELHNSYSLNEICKRLGLPEKDETLLREAASAFDVDPKRDLWKLPGRFVGPYGEGDADRPLRVLRKQEARIEELDLWKVHNLESRVLPVLVKMRRRGIRVDMDRLAAIEEWTILEETEALRKVKHLTGVDIGIGNSMNAGAVAPALIAIGIDLDLTSTGVAHIDKDVLGEIDHPVAKAISWARKTNKLRTTFAASIRTYMTNGRIHCTFNQIAREDEKGDMKGARYGRLSCVDPNMQQQPSRDEFAKRWRSIYLPEEGAVFFSNDYSQQEPRWTTHFAAELEANAIASHNKRLMEDFKGALAAAQMYHDDPKLDNHTFMAQLTGLPRKYAKNVYLGLCYGEGGAKLSTDCGVPTRWALTIGRGRDRKTEFYSTRSEALEARARAGDGYAYETAGVEGQKIIDTFDARAPWIRKLAAKASEVAKAQGFITTGGGRQLHFPQREDGSYDWAHKALNRAIQGTSADQTKEAIVQVDAAGYFLQLQVHDELNGSVRDRAEAECISTIMSNVLPARVPFRVDVEVGPSWGEAV
jgi:DNA polymerase I-like protein with 3'-5' exonuclease and polymerase domains